MGLELAAGLTMGSQVAGGFLSKSAYGEQASMERSYAEMQMQEHYRTALQIESEGRRFAQSQKMAYIGSGVQIGGSAVVTLAQTKKWASAEASAMRSRGKALRAYGFRSAALMEKKGSADMISGILGAATTFMGVKAAQKAAD